jgi:hypothetical protein
MFDLLQVTIRCTDIPLDELAEAARAVEHEFRKFCPWHQSVRCWVEGTHLFLRAQNDFDADGEAICEDLRSCLKNSVSALGRIEVVAVKPLPKLDASATLRVHDRLTKA